MSSVTDVDIPLTKPEASLWGHWRIRKRGAVESGDAKLLHE